LIDEHADGDVTQAAFCQAKKLSLASFQNWKRRLAAEAPALPSAEPWLELGALAEHRPSGWDIELDLGDGLSLRLRRC
jgi:hypothetical protein